MASIEDKITRVMDGSAYPNVARVVSPRATGSDTLMTDGLSGWSTETAMNFITYRADSAGNVIEGTVRDWIGVANKVNSSIINLKLLAGPEDDGSNVGDIVQPCASASYADRLAQALLEILDTTGKPRPKAIPLAGINGGTTAGILTILGQSAQERLRPLILNLPLYYQECLMCKVTAQHQIKR